MWQFLLSRVIGVCINFSPGVKHVLVSSAAIFWDVTQRSPQRNGCSQPNNIPFHCVCGLVAVYWKDQSHNSKVRMTYTFARKGLRCGQCQCCFTPHARNQKRAVIEGYDHAGRKNKCGWKPKYKCFMCSSLCSANERIYIFWKCLIVSINQGLKASYR